MLTSSFLSGAAAPLRRKALFEGRRRIAQRALSPAFPGGPAFSIQRFYTFVNDESAFAFTTNAKQETGKKKQQKPEATRFGEQNLREYYKLHTIFPAA